MMRDKRWKIKDKVIDKRFWKKNSCEFKSLYAIKIIKC